VITPFCICETATAPVSSLRFPSFWKEIAPVTPSKEILCSWVTTPERKLLIEDDAFNFSNDLMIALVPS